MISVSPSLSRGHSIEYLSIILAFLLSACDSDGIISGDATTDEPRVDPIADWSDTDPCGDYTDSDGDTIADSIEGSGDWDGDTIPNLLDPDSDGDTIPDSVEAGDDDLCTHPVNSDRGYDEHGNPTGDELPDFLDMDSDEDGLTDFDETHVHGTDPTQPDTDHDTVSDLAEVAAGSDPLDPSSLPPEGVYVIELPYLPPDHTFPHVRAEVTEGPVDVQGLAVDVPGDPPEAEYDSTMFVKDITPYEGFPTAPEGFSSMDETTFHDVVPGTLVQFELDLYNNTVPPIDVFQVFRVWIDVVGEGSTVFDTLEFILVVPTEWGGWLGP